MDGEASNGSNERSMYVFGEGSRVAHVIYFDRIRYSALPVEIRIQYDEDLFRYLREKTPVQELVDKGEAISIDSGDGMALVFFGDPRIVAEVALKLGEHSQSCPLAPLRIGVHTGTVVERIDISGKKSVTGPGIDKAARVMSCADAHVVYVSAFFAENLRSFDGWFKTLRDEGPHVVKHQEIMHLFSLQIFRFSGLSDTERQETLRPKSDPVPLLPDRSKDVPPRPKSKLPVMLLCGAALAGLVYVAFRATQPKPFSTVLIAKPYPGQDFSSVEGGRTASLMYGFAQMTDGRQIPLRWTAGQPTAMDSKTDSGWAVGELKDGRVGGFAAQGEGKGVGHAGYWEGGSFVRFNVENGKKFSYTWGCRDNGWLCGFTSDREWTACQDVVGFVRTPEEKNVLVSSDTYPWSAFCDINRHGVAVGKCALREHGGDWAHYMPFQWSVGGGMQLLEMPYYAMGGTAEDINDEGEIAGEVWTRDAMYGASWDKRGKLESIVPTNGWQETCFWGISPKGTKVGWTTRKRGETDRTLCVQWSDGTVERDIPIPPGVDALREGIKCTDDGGIILTARVGGTILPVVLRGKG